MAGEEKLVAVVSPWDKLAELVKQKFRVESIPGQKQVMVWRDDLQSADALQRVLSDLGVKASAVEPRSVTNWKSQT